MMILVKKDSISFNTNIIYLLCPLSAGIFFQETAIGGLSYKVKKGAAFLGQPLSIICTP